MRLLNNTVRKGLILGLSVALAACGRGGEEPRAIASASDMPARSDAFGPEADYPQVLGDPFTVDGTLFTPEDVLSYDSVGYAALDAAAGPGVTIAHKTLPMPSYVEVTSLDSGTTILARVTSRGPMTSSRLAALSPDAAIQIGIGDGGAIRVRRVNPPEHERTKLRSGQTMPTRLEMPQSLIAVLRKKLPAEGSASLRSPAAERARATMASSEMPSRSSTVATSSSALADAPLPPSRSSKPPVSTGLAQSFDNAFANRRSNSRAYPLPPLAGVSVAAPARPLPPVAQASRPVVVAARATQPAGYSLPGGPIEAATPVVANLPAPVTQQADNISEYDSSFVIQAAAFSNKRNAERAATTLEGFVRKTGRFYRVRTGPYATRGQAEAALAKVRAAGYSDARVFTAG